MYCLFCPPRCSAGADALFPTLSPSPWLLLALWTFTICEHSSSFLTISIIWSTGELWFCRTSASVDELLPDSSFSFSITLLSDFYKMFVSSVFLIIKSISISSFIFRRHCLRMSWFPGCFPLPQLLVMLLLWLFHAFLAPYKFLFSYLFVNLFLFRLRLLE